MALLQDGLYHIYGNADDSRPLDVINNVDVVVGDLIDNQIFILRNHPTELVSFELAHSSIGFEAGILKIVPDIVKWKLFKIQGLDLFAVFKNDVSGNNWNMDTNVKNSPIQLTTNPPTIGTPKQRWRFVLIKGVSLT